MKRSKEINVGYDEHTGKWSIELSAKEARFIADTLRGAMNWTADNTSRFAHLFEAQGYEQGYDEVTEWAASCVVLHKKLLGYAIFIENHEKEEQ